VRLGPAEGLEVECVASMDNILTLSKSLLVSRVGVLATQRRHELCEALRAAVDC
jgi:mRNA-degrading endonuclease toxin of MazEF toxin-antitoxin module